MADFKKQGPSVIFAFASPTPANQSALNTLGHNYSKPQQLSLRVFKVDLERKRKKKVCNLYPTRPSTLDIDIDIDLYLVHIAH